MKKTIYKIISAMAVLALTFLSYGHSSAEAQPARNIRQSNSSIYLASGNPMPVGQTSGFDLVFADEFDSGSLDLTKWRPNWLMSSDTAISQPVNSAEVSCYNPANVKVTNGELNLNAAVNSDSNCKNRSGATAKYSSGLIEFNGKFDFTYGYVEARMWVPAGTGVWPAFWTDGSGLNWPTGEIDVVECYGTDASCSYHYHYSGGGPGGNSKVVGSTTGWHTYAANWQFGKIEWFYDGAKVGEQTQGVISVPHFLIVNLGLKGTNPTVPSTLRVDYVRVWKNAPGIPSNTATPAPVIITPTLVFPTSTIVAATPTLESPTIAASTTPMLLTATPILTQAPLTNTPPIVTSTPAALPTSTQIIVINPTATPSLIPVPIPLDSYASVYVSSQSMILGETGFASVNLNRIPAQGARSVEFTCTYPNGQLEISNILISSLFGPDPVSALNGPQNGIFIVAIAGSNGNKIITDGVVFTFNVKALQVGQFNVECQARISRGDNSLEGISFVPASITILGNSPTATQLSAPVISGQILATKPVIIRLFNTDASLAAQTNANIDGTFSLTAPAGSYTIVASAEGFLDAQSSVTLVDGVNIIMPLVKLPAGDIDNNDVIDQFDAMTIGMSYNAAVPSAADLNSNDGIINVLDLEVLSEFYRESGALSWY